MTAPDSRRVVLFDLDGVLTRRDTFGTLVTRRLQRQPWRLPATGPALPLLGLSVSVPRLRGPVARHLVRSALFGVSLKAGREECAALGAEFAATPSWLRAEAIAAAIEYVDAGARVVVVTATERHLARALLDGVGLDAVELVASELARTPLGLELNPHNYGPAKLDGLARAGIRPPFAVMHSDSAADLPLLRLADEPVLVAAPRADVRRVRERLGRQPEAFAWQ